MKNLEQIKSEARDKARASIVCFNNLCHSEILPIAYEKTMDELADTIATTSYNAGIESTKK